jgi:hypothetical protein
MNKTVSAKYQQIVYLAKNSDFPIWLKRGNGKDLMLCNVRL